jgi:hypothetical protein
MAETTQTKVDLSTETKFTTKLYKVLHPQGGKRLTGGNTNFDWSPYLPKNGKPGKPCEISTKNPLRACQYGLHVTTRPAVWGMGLPNSFSFTFDDLIDGCSPDEDYDKNRVFEVKVFGPVQVQGDKVCAYKVQLVREIVSPKSTGTAIATFKQLVKEYKAFEKKVDKLGKTKKASVSGEWGKVYNLKGPSTPKLAKGGK